MATATGKTTNGRKKKSTPTNRISKVAGKPKAVSKPAKKTKVGDGSTFIEIAPLKEGTVIAEVGGKAVLSHHFGKKARDQMLADQQKKGKTKDKPKRVPEQDFKDAMHIIKGDRNKPFAKGTIHGLPAAAFRKGMVRAGKGMGIHMTDSYLFLRVQGHPDAPSLLPITFKKLEMHESYVRLSGKTADLRFRPIYTEWKCQVRIEYDATIIGPDSVLHLLTRAGRYVGVGDWRLEKGGDMGGYDILQAKLLRETIFANVLAVSHPHLK